MAGLCRAAELVHSNRVLIEYTRGAAAAQVGELHLVIKITVHDSIVAFAFR